MDAEQVFVSPAFIGFATGALSVVLVVTIAGWLGRVRRRRGAAAREALAQTHRRNELIVAASGEGILELDHAGLVRFANPAAARLLGYGVEGLIGLNYHVLIEAPEQSTSSRMMRYTTDIKTGVFAVLKHQDGRRRPIEYRIVPIMEQGTAVGTVFVFSDISERVRLDAMLKDSQSTAHVGGWEVVPDTGRLSWTDEIYRIHELPIGQQVTLEQAIGFYAPEDRGHLQVALAAAVEHGTGFDLELTLVTARGRRRTVHAIARVDRRTNRSVRIYGTFQDITERKLVEQELKATRDFYQRTLDVLPAGVAYINEQGSITFCNHAYASQTGFDQKRIVGTTLRNLLGEERYSTIASGVEAVMRGEPQNFMRSAVVGDQHVEWRINYIPDRRPDGTVRGFFAVIHDLTEFKRLEEHLLRAQKMQAIGQLTGGIAHDFNNLLGIVLGNLQLLERELRDGDPALVRKIRTAMRAAMRGADLTRRLLAFARRQILDPVVLDLKHQLTSLSDLLQRTLGDSIEIRMELQPDLWRTRVDPGQLENAIINLAINARDAMPEGGKVRFEARNRLIQPDFCVNHPQIEPGEYVAVSVSDTGCGIPPNILARVLEPFFTTKEHGGGSGLGLPMVYGFAEQSGGVATIESELGRGTTVTLFLPKAVASEEPSYEDTIVQKVMPGGSETILVVEDDADLRETVITALRQLGYHTLDAANAREALPWLAGDERIDLLFTDVMMPGGMLGPALAQRARELRPGLGVLFTTGFAESGVLASGAGVAASDVIPKPYRIEDLALRIRQMIDRESRIA